jgi:hypothetical protein
MMRILLGMGTGEMRIFLEERKYEVTTFVLASLRPE